MKNFRKSVAALFLALSLVLTACSSAGSTSSSEAASSSSQVSVSSEQTETSSAVSTVSKSASSIKPVSLGSVPAFSNKPYVAVNGNKPNFSVSDFTTKVFEKYSSLDSLGRCGVAFANVCKETMPTKERGSIGMIKPSGWHIAKYDFVDGKYLYNRCHLIGYQLTAENANQNNLITGTRYLNVEGMLPFENMVADYVKETGHHVLYRVTPVFKGNNLVADGVQMEAESVEDKGKGVSFNVFCYNNQPGVKIDYATGTSKATNSSTATAASSSALKAQKVERAENTKSQTYILNTSTKKFHRPSCSEVKKIKSSHKKTYTGSRAQLIAQGYKPCKICNP